MPTHEPASATIDLGDAVGAVTEVLRNKGLDPADVDSETPLTSLGLDSLDLAEVLVILEEKAGCWLDLYSVRPLQRVGDLARLAPLEGGR
jgi:acyl carrier protein